MVMALPLLTTFMSKAPVAVTARPNPVRAAAFPRLTDTALLKVWPNELVEALFPFTLNPPTVTVGTKQLSVVVPALVLVLQSAQALDAGRNVSAPPESAVAAKSLNIFEDFERPRTHA